VSLISFRPNVRHKVQIDRYALRSRNGKIKAVYCFLSRRYVNATLLRIGSAFTDFIGRCIDWKPKTFSLYSCTIHYCAV